MENDKLTIQITKDAYVKTIVKKFSEGDTALFEEITRCFIECLNEHGLKMVWNIAHGHVIKQTIFPGQEVYVKPKVVCGWSYDCQLQESLLHNGYMRGIVTKVSLYAESPLIVSFEIFKAEGEKDSVERHLKIEDVNIENYG